MSIQLNISPAEMAVLAERRRQVVEEGFTPSHDDAHTDAEIARAASCYAQWPAARNAVERHQIRTRWPWVGSFKPRGTRKDLVRAAALLIAEIERLDRAEERS